VLVGCRVLALVDSTWLGRDALVTSDSVLIKGLDSESEGVYFDCLRIEREIPATVRGVSFGGSLKLFLISETLDQAPLQIRERFSLRRSLSVQLRKVGWKIYLPPESMSPQVQELRPGSVYKPYYF
jgi:hypothetical protein